MSFQHLEKNGLTILIAEQLSAGGVVHGFSTRPGGVSAPPFDSLNLGLGRGDDVSCVRENFRRFCAAIGADEAKLVCSRQVHGDAVRVVTQVDAGKGLDFTRDYDVDALITDVPALPLVIFSADCIPVLLHDPVRSVVGACHAGWRGTALGIAEKTVKKMQQAFGCRPSDLHCAIGAGISRCCFETDADVPQAMREALGAQAEGFIEALGNARYRVDLKGMNRHWLMRAGVDEANIEISDDCTACNQALFYSHRRVGNARGSLAAIIQLV